MKMDYSTLEENKAGPENRDSFAVEDFEDDEDDVILARAEELSAKNDQAPHENYEDLSEIDFDEEMETDNVANISIGLENTAGSLSNNEDGFDRTSGKLWIYPTNYPVRDYQFNIAQQGLFKNTLVVLPTGLGKTFIAAVVMYNLYRWFPSGKIIFMAPTKPLVMQQIQACYNIMGIPKADTVEMTGTMPPAVRQKAWKEKRVVFLTPQVMTNDLGRGSCVAESVKCLVVDEAHKAQGNHAYCQVVRELVKFTRQFRILALSATPGTDLKAVQQVVVNLLISHIELRTEESIDIQPYTHHRKVDKIVVPLGEELTGIRLQYIQIMNVIVQRLIRNRVLYNREATKLSKFLILKARDEYRQNPPQNIQPAHYGNIEADFALAMSLYHGFELLQLHGLRSLYNYLMGIVVGEKGYGRTRSELMRNADFNDIMEKLRQKFASSLESGSHKDGDTKVVVGHPKMQRLEEIVLEHFKTFKQSGQDTRVMIFSQYRDSVQEIADILNQHQPLIKTMPFIGQSSAGKAIKGYTQKEQLKVMRQFREGGYNTLVSTCVGEEGLDIGDVDLIVCFDAHKSPVRLVQRMGRTGRKREGRIVMLITEGKEEQIYNQSLYSKKNIHKAILNGAKSLQFYPSNPRLVPASLFPQCHKMHITVEKDSEQRKAKVTSRLKGGENRKVSDLFGKQKSAKNAVSNGELSVEEYEEIKEEFEHVSKLAKHLPSPKCLCLSSRKETLMESPFDPLAINLSEWMLWQNCHQKSFLSGHSTRSEHLVKDVDFMELQRIIGEKEDSYGYEMKLFLHPEDVIGLRQGGAQSSIMSFMKGTGDKSLVDEGSYHMNSSGVTSGIRGHGDRCSTQMRSGGSGDVWKTKKSELFTELKPKDPDQAVVDLTFETGEDYLLDNVSSATMLKQSKRRVGSPLNSKSKILKKAIKRKRVSSKQKLNLSRFVDKISRDKNRKKRSIFQLYETTGVGCTSDKDDFESCEDIITENTDKAGIVQEVPTESRKNQQVPGVLQDGRSPICEAVKEEVKINKKDKTAAVLDLSVSEPLQQGRNLTPTHLGRLSKFVSKTGSQNKNCAFIQIPTPPGTDEVESLFQGLRSGSDFAELDLEMLLERWKNHGEVWQGLQESVISKEQAGFSEADHCIPNVMDMSVEGQLLKNFLSEDSGQCLSDCKCEKLVNSTSKPCLARKDMVQDLEGDSHESTGAKPKAAGDLDNESDYYSEHRLGSNLSSNHNAFLKSPIFKSLSGAAVNSKPSTVRKSISFSERVSMCDTQEDNAESENGKWEMEKIKKLPLEPLNDGPEHGDISLPVEIMEDCWESMMNVEKNTSHSRSFVTFTQAMTCLTDSGAESSLECKSPPSSHCQNATCHSHDQTILCSESDSVGLKNTLSPTVHPEVVGVSSVSGRSDVITKTSDGVFQKNVSDPWPEMSPCQRRVKDPSRRGKVRMGVNCSGTESTKVNLEQKNQEMPMSNLVQHIDASPCLKRVESCVPSSKGLTTPTKGTRTSCSSDEDLPQFDLGFDLEEDVIPPTPEKNHNLLSSSNRFVNSAVSDGIKPSKDYCHGTVSELQPPIHNDSSAFQTPVATENKVKNTSDVSYTDLSDLALWENVENLELGLTTNGVNTKADRTAATSMASDSFTHQARPESNSILKSSTCGIGGKNCRIPGQVSSGCTVSRSGVSIASEENEHCDQSQTSHHEGLFSSRHSLAPIRDTLSSSSDSRDYSGEKIVTPDKPYNNCSSLATNTLRKGKLRLGGSVLSDSYRSSRGSPPNLSGSVHPMQLKHLSKPRPVERENISKGDREVSESVNSATSDCHLSKNMGVDLTPGSGKAVRRSEWLEGRMASTPIRMQKERNPGRQRPSMVLNEDEVALTPIKEDPADSDESFVMVRKRKRPLLFDSSSDQERMTVDLGCRTKSLPGGARSSTKTLPESDQHTSLCHDLEDDGDDFKDIYNQRNASLQPGRSHLVKTSEKALIKRKKQKGLAFIEEEAEVTGDEASADEEEENDDYYEHSFINNNTEMTQATDMRAVYLQSMKSMSSAQAVHGRFKLQFQPQDLDNVFSQALSDDYGMSEYEQDSFCVSSDEDPSNEQGTQVKERVKRKRKRKETGSAKTWKVRDKKRIRMLSCSTSEDEGQNNIAMTQELGTVNRSSMKNFLQSSEEVEEAETLAPAMSLPSLSHPGSRLNSELSEQKYCPIGGKKHVNIGSEEHSGNSMRLNITETYKLSEECSERKGCIEAEGEADFDLLGNDEWFSDMNFSPKKDCGNDSNASPLCPNPSSGPRTMFRGQGHSAKDCVHNSNVQSKDWPQRHINMDSVSSVIDQPALHQVSPRLSGSTMGTEHRREMVAEDVNCEKFNSTSVGTKKTVVSVLPFVGPAALLPVSTANEACAASSATTTSGSWQGQSALPGKTSSANSRTDLLREERLRKQKEKQDRFRHKLGLVRMAKAVLNSEPGSVTLDQPSDASVTVGTSGVSSQFNPDHSESWPDVLASQTVLNAGNSALLTSPKPQVGEHKSEENLQMLVDSKEISGAHDIISALRLQYKLKVTARQLAFCDYIVSNYLAVDRMHWSVFSNSTQRNKLASRLCDMQEMYDRCVLIVESDQSKTSVEKVKRPIPHTKYVNSTLSYLAQTKVRVYFTDSMDETAALLSELCHMEAKKGRGLLSPTCLSARKEEMFKFVMSLPKVTVPQALNLVQGFRSIFELTTSPAQLIQDRGCMTTISAHAIHSFLRHRFDLQMMPSSKR